ncbi:fibrous sheath-interacting protein 1 [Hydra vulgaris]|uniref:fibrous sheath-interacting protein 1 n=1 Tax=Hydra vulgaris TaxID=6087 RepID=UPI001F5F8983|nr:fibrous sheath-interacting protein 1 [Hydra vulgaris]
MKNTSQIEDNHNSGSIIRNSRDNFVSEFEILPTEVNICNHSTVEKDSFSDTPTIQGIKIKKSFNPNDKNEVEDNIEIKICKGMERIQKLDKLLSEKVAYEKEVKRDRKCFEKEMQHKIKLLEEKKNSVSNEFIKTCHESNSVGSQFSNTNETPIFSTQIGEKHYELSDQVFHKTVEQIKNDEFNTEPNKFCKNFVKRNMQLASRAKYDIALTEEEEKRLFEILNDEHDILLDENPFSILTQSCISHEEHSENDRKKIENIDEKLKDFLSNEEYVLLNEELPFFHFLPNDVGGCGEQVLQEKHDERTLKNKIKEIDDKLLDLKNDDKPLIDPDLLRRLLDNNLRLTSACTTICESVCSADNFELEKL